MPDTQYRPAFPERVLAQAHGYCALELLFKNQLHQVLSIEFIHHRTYAQLLQPGVLPKKAMSTASRVQGRWGGFA